MCFENKIRCYLLLLQYILINSEKENKDLQVIIFDIKQIIFEMK